MHVCHDPYSLVGSTRTNNCVLGKCNMELYRTLLAKLIEDPPFQKDPYELCSQMKDQAWKQLARGFIGWYHKLILSTLTTFSHFYNISKFSSVFHFPRFGGMLVQLRTQYDISFRDELISQAPQYFISSLKICLDSLGIISNIFIYMA